MAALRSQFQHGEQEGLKLKRRFEWLKSFTDEELRKISLCTVDEGEKQSSEVYFDLSRPELGPLKGQSGAVVPEGSCYVAKSRLDPKTWNKLLNGYAR